MKSRTKTYWKRLAYLFIGVFVVCCATIGALGFILRDSIAMNHGSCKVLFSDLRSPDLNLRSQADGFMNAAIRRVNAMNESDLIDDELYTRTVNSFEQICERHSEYNFFDVQLAYGGFKSN
jgi:hypothetical protein